LQEYLGEFEQYSRPLFFLLFFFNLLCILRFLKEKNQQIKVILADPNGSSLFNKVKYNVCYAKQQSEKTIRKHRYDSIVEGVGLDRITQNFNQAIIDDAYQIPDQDLLIIAHWMLKHEGLMIGSSTALNLAAVLRALNLFQDGDAIVTIACDNGNRHLSRFWNPSYVEKYLLRWPEDDQVDGEFEKLLHS
jgi:cysteine synthase A